MTPLLKCQDGEASPDPSAGPRDEPAHRPEEPGGITESRLFDKHGGSPRRTFTPAAANLIGHRRQVEGNSLFVFDRFVCLVSRPALKRLLMTTQVRTTLRHLFIQTFTVGVFVAAALVLILVASRSL